MAAESGRANSYVCHDPCTFHRCRCLLRATVNSRASVAECKFARSPARRDSRVHRSRARESDPAFATDRNCVFVFRSRDRSRLARPLLGFGPTDFYWAQNRGSVNRSQSRQSNAGSHVSVVASRSPFSDRILRLCARRDVHTSSESLDRFTSATRND